MKTSTQIGLVLLLAAKIAICSLFVFDIDLESLIGSGAAIASEPRPDTVNASNQMLREQKAPEVDFSFLAQKMAELKRKEQTLESRKAELLALQTELNQKIEALSKLRNEIKTEINKKETIEKQKIKHLIKAYSAMKPQSAADLIERLSPPFAIQLLSQMKGETVGTILTFVNKEKAAKLIEGLARRN